MAVIVWAVLVVAFLMRDTYRIDHANYFAGTLQRELHDLRKGAANQDQHQHVGRARLRNRQ